MVVREYEVSIPVGCHQQPKVVPDSDDGCSCNMQCNAIVHLVSSKINTVIRQYNLTPPDMNVELLEWKPHNNHDSQAASTSCRNP
jgi:hypothetical protein